MRSISTLLRTTLLIFLFVVRPVRGAPGRRVAVTFDDLPGDENLDSGSLHLMTDAILSALESHDVPTIGFVTGKRVLVDDQTDERIEILEQWMNAGATLGNHTFSHIPLSKVPFETYKRDVIKGELFPAHAMTERSQKVEFFRAPENDLGASSDIHDSLRSFLESLDYKLAPFTIEHADYAFNGAFLRAEADGDLETVARIKAAYLEQLDLAFGFFEELSAEMFQRQISQIFLIHANRLNAEMLDAILSNLQDRGYEFISLSEAVRDPAYSTPDEYGGPFGLSWFHRWSLSLGYGTRETAGGRIFPETLWREPDAPEFVVELAQQSP